MLSDRITLDLVGVYSTLTDSYGAAAALNARATVDVNVPSIGEGVTWVYMDPIKEIEVSPGVNPPATSCSSILQNGADSPSTPNGTQLMPVGVDQGFRLATVDISSPASSLSYLPLPPNQTVRLVIPFACALLSREPGVFHSRTSFRFRVPTPSVGMGDLNGDNNVDLLDSTLLRRSLAGLPGWP